MATAAWIPVKQLFVGLLAAENPFKNLLTLPSYSSRQPAPPSQYISVHNYSLCLWGGGAPWLDEGGQLGPGPLHQGEEGVEGRGWYGLLE